MPKCSVLPRQSVLLLDDYDAPQEGRLSFTRLDFNENTGSREYLEDSGLSADLSCYPEYSLLRSELSRLFDVEENQLVLTNGSDEALLLIGLSFVEPGVDSVLVSSPTFAMIPRVLSLAGARVRSVSVKQDLSFDVEAIEQCLTAGKVKLAMFASPDNPTGSCLSEEVIQHWCRNFPGTLFVIDEAYAEYAGTTAIKLTAENANLIVTRTFSKAWGLAGLRLGVVIGQASILDPIRRVALPYNVNSVAVSAARVLIPRYADIQQRARCTMERKTKLLADLERLGYSAIDGKGNFLLLKVGYYAGNFCRYMADMGILVRNRSRSLQPDGSPLWGMVRVTVGTEDEIERFLKAVAEFNNSYAVSFDLDGTLVDTSTSFDATICRVVELYNGGAVTDEDIAAIRLEGGFNDDWDLARELLRRRGIEADIQELSEKAVQLYLQIAKKEERLMLDPAILKLLRRRHKLTIVTGRRQFEYEPVWQDSIGSLFDKVYCRDDDTGLAPKPSPDYLQRMQKEFATTDGVYIGNSVDDMKAAVSAGLRAIGVGTGQDTFRLQIAGASFVLSDVSTVREIFLV